MTEAQAIVRRLKIWSGPVEVEPLGGGLSNTNFVVTDGARRAVVRLGNDLPFHHVFRDREVAIARAAHAVGISPAVLHAEPGVTVTTFLGARTYGADDVRRNWRRILPVIETCHRHLAEHLVGPPTFFWVFHVIRDYAHTLAAGGHRLAGHLPGWLAEARRLEAAQIPMPIVFGHHDLLPANILDDGDRLWLVDWEYGGFGTPLFDLANLAGNAGFDPDEERDLLAAYFGRQPEESLLDAYRAMKAASLLREALWSMVSELHLSAPGADYVAYAAENLDRYRAAWLEYDRKAG